MVDRKDCQANWPTLLRCPHRHGPVGPIVFGCHALIVKLPPAKYHRRLIHSPQDSASLEVTRSEPLLEIYLPALTHPLPVRDSEDSAHARGYRVAAVPLSTQLVALWLAFLTECEPDI